MLELSNLSHCVQHTWKDISRDFGALGMKESYFLRKKNFGEMLWGISETVNARAFKPYAIVFSTPENLLVGISGALEWKEATF